MSVHTDDLRPGRTLGSGAARRSATGIRAGLLALLALATSIPAHDFWLQPTPFEPAVGERVELRLVVGEQFVGDAVARNEKRILSFVAIGPDGKSHDAPGIDGRAPAGIWRATSPGVHVVGYRSNGQDIELDAEKFEDYLVEEGLEHVVRDRKARGETARKGRERYARCAKSILLARGDGEVTDAQRAGWDRVLGYPLEIVPEVDPLRLAVGAKLPVRVLFQGAPLANGLVGCMPQRDPAREVRLRTDAEGRVTFEPVLRGAHLVRVVHMTRAPEGSGHDWESQWASLTFELPR